MVVSWELERRPFRGLVKLTKYAASTKPKKNRTAMRPPKLVTAAVAAEMTPQIIICHILVSCLLLDIHSRTDYVNN